MEEKDKLVILAMKIIICASCVHKPLYFLRLMHCTLSGYGKSHLNKPFV